MKTLATFLSAACLSFTCSAYQQIPDVSFKQTSNLSTIKFNTQSVAPVTTISKTQIQKSGAQTIQQVLQFTGLQLRDVDGDGSNLQVSLRGFGGNAGQNILVLLNGHPLTYADLGSYNFNQIAINSIEAIQIYNSSMGVLYGNQAVGGVINIITKKAEANQEYAGVSAGSYDTYQAQAGLSRQVSKSFAYHFDILGHKSQMYREHNKTDNFNVDVGMHKTFAHSQLHLEYEYYQQNLLYPGALTAAQVAQNRRQAQTDTDSFDNSIHNLQADYNWQLNNDWQLQLNSLLHQMNGKGILTTDYNNKRNAIDLIPEIQGLIHLGTLQVINATGIAFKQSQYQFNSATYNSKATQKVYAVFNQLKLPLTTHWDIIGGARYASADSAQTIAAAKQTAVNDAFIGKVGIKWHPNKTMDLDLRAAGNYRFPTTDENIDTNTGKPLKTQTGTSYEFGVAMQLARLQGLLSLYHIDLNNEITAVPIPNSTTSFALNQNLPRTHRNGLALHLTYQLLKPWSVQGIYHYVDAKFSSGPDKGNRIPFVAEQTYTLSSLLNISSHWVWGLEDVFTGSRTFGNDPEQRSPLLNGYSLYNTSLSYQQKMWQLSLRINNLTNHYYNAYAFDMYNGTQTTQYFYPAMGINYMLSLMVKM